MDEWLSMDIVIGRVRWPSLHKAPQLSESGIHYEGQAGFTNLAGKFQRVPHPPPHQNKFLVFCKTHLVLAQS